VGIVKDLERKEAMRLRRLRWWERMLIRLIPARRRDYEQHLEETMRWLIDHPEVPVDFD
jgi:hypothetical protein